MTTAPRVLTVDFTSTTAATVTGDKATPSGTVIVKANGVQKGTATADGSGNWTANCTSLTGTSITFTANMLSTVAPTAIAMEVCMARIHITGSATQTNVHPTASANLFLYNSGVISSRIMVYQYRAQGATDWIIDGAEITDGSGNTTHTYAVALTDGNWELNVTAGTVDSGFVEIISETLAVLINKPNEAPVLPPDYGNWGDETANGKWGYLDCMRISPNTAVTTVLGTIPTINIPKPAVTWSITSGGTNVAVNSSTGELSVNNGALAAGDYSFTLQASNSAGSDSITLQLHVQTPATTRIRYIDAVNGADSNDGTLPTQAFQTMFAWRAWRGANSSGAATVYLKRGQTHTDATGLRMYASTTYSSYGDPSAEKPHCVSSGTACLYQAATITGALRVEDLWLTATQRPLDGSTGSSGTTATFIRCTFQGNTATATSDPVYMHGWSGLSFLHNTIPDNEHGDGVYLRKLGTSNRLSRNVIMWNYFGIPSGGGADNLQITSERKAGMDCYDILVSNNIFRHAPTSNSTKGNLVTEGAHGVLVEKNDFEGRYFCYSQLSSNVTVRDNVFKNGNLNDNSFGIGTGALDNTANVNILLNTMSDCYNGFAISGYDDPTGGWQRVDYRFFFNTIKNSTRVAFLDRPWSGFVEQNVGYSNSSNAITRQGEGNTIATGGAYTTQSISPNYFNSAAGPTIVTTPTISGTVTPTSVLTVTVPAISGCTSSVQWILNGDRAAGATNLTYTVPSGTPDDVCMPAFADTPWIGCAVIYTDGSGNETVVAARFSDGSMSAVIS